MSRRAVFPCIFLISFAFAGYLRSQVAPAQFPSSHAGETTRTAAEDVRLPNGKLQSDEILKQEHEKSLDDARQLISLSQALQKDLEQSGANVLSISGIHKTEEIEKLARRIRSRMRRS